MALAGTIVVGIVLVLGLLNGLRRGAIKEGIVLIAVLCGALLVTLWSERSGAAIVRRMSWQPGTGQWLAAMGLLWIAALGAGYSPGALLPVRPGKMALPMRIGGAVLGLLTAGLLVALSLRYTQFMLFNDPDGDRKSWIRLGVASRFLVDHFDIMLLGLVWAIAVVSLVVIVGKLITRLVSPNRPLSPVRPQPGLSRPPATTPQPTMRDAGAPGGAAPTPPGMERSFIDKPRTPAGGDRSGPVS